MSSPSNGAEPGPDRIPYDEIAAIEAARPRIPITVKIAKETAKVVGELRKGQKGQPAKFHGVLKEAAATVLSNRLTNGEDVFVSSRRAHALIDSFLGNERVRESFERVDDGSPVFRMADLASADLSKTWLVKDIFPGAAVGMLVGESNTGKTFLAIDLALSVAFDEPWIGNEIINPGPVLFVLAEGQRQFVRRLAGWLYDHGHLPSPSVSRAEIHEALDGKVYVVEQPVSFDHPEFQEAIQQTVEKHDIRLVIYDTLAKLLGRDASEMDNDDAAWVTATLTDVATETGASQLLLHHTGQRNKWRGRGAKAWEDGVEIGYIIRPSRPYRDTRSDLQAGRPVKLKAWKMKEAPLPADTHFKLDTLDLDFSEFGDDSGLGSAVIRHVDSAAVLADVRREPAEYVEGIRSDRGNTLALHTVLQILAKAGPFADEEFPAEMSRQDIEEGFNAFLKGKYGDEAQLVSSRGIRRLLSDLRDKDLIDQEGENRYSRYEITETGHSYAGSSPSRLAAFLEEEADNG